MSLYANRVHHDAQAHRFNAEAERAARAQAWHGEPSAHVVAYYQSRHRAHAAAWLALLLSEKVEA